jgi:uncharacterized protein
MSAVFADTFYFLALANRNDEAHRKCVQFSETFDSPVITTTWVLMELGDAFRKGRDRETFAKILQQLKDDPDTTIVAAEQRLFEQAVSLFRSRPDKTWSLTDCTSFVVMQERSLTEALTQDHHFEQAGFIALLK